MIQPIAANRGDDVKAPSDRPHPTRPVAIGAVGRSNIVFKTSITMQSSTQNPFVAVNSIVNAFLDISLRYDFATTVKLQILKCSVISSTRIYYTGSRRFMH